MTCNYERKLAVLKGPKGKHIFGTVKVGERGQIVIPKEAREIFGIRPGDSLLVVGDEAQGIAILKSGAFMDFALKIFDTKEDVEDDGNRDKVVD